MIQNPILSGFHSDPSILRVGEDYYVVTSSFVWFPAIPIFHSKDLKHWEQIGNILTKKSQLDLTRVHPACGIWSPELSYCEAEKRFYLVYTNVLSENIWMFDSDNYLMWTDDILSGEWSDPVYINSSGFDCSLLHDDDGRKWFLNKDRDFRNKRVDSRGIVIQEFDAKLKRLVGEPKIISHGATERRFVEGPHLFKKDGWYYLLTAEGGTGYGHCEAISRSRSPLGPYEAYPYNPIITSNPENYAGTESTAFMRKDKYNPDTLLQKAGHGCLVETHTGEWYMVHLASRPIMPQMRCVLGREAAIQKMEWTEDGWLRMAGGTNVAQTLVPQPQIPEHPFEEREATYKFTSEGLPCWLYTPHNEITDDWADVKTKPGKLRLHGRESLNGLLNVSLLARVLSHFKATVTTSIDFEPEKYQEMAGLTCYYDQQSYFCAFKTYDEDFGSDVVAAHGFTNNKYVELNAMVPIPSNTTVYLQAKIDTGRLQFMYSLDGENFEPLGDEADVTVLSDEESTCGNFTGTYVGMFAQDSYRKEKWAEFNWFRYEGEE